MVENHPEGEAALRADAVIAIDDCHARAIFVNGDVEFERSEADVRIKDSRRVRDGFAR
jgi:hypothetical protein